LNLISRFVIAVAATALSLVWGLIAEPASSARMFLFGFALMILAPVSIAYLIDIARIGQSVQSSVRNSFAGKLASYFAVAFSLCSLFGGTYLLGAVLFSSDVFGAGSILFTAILGVVLFGFGFKLLRSQVSASEVDT
jgi:MFS family permease